MAKLRASNIEPQSGTNLTLGATGDSVTISSTEVRANTVKDAGANTLWTSNGSGTLSSVNSALAGGGITLLNTTVLDDVDYVEYTSTYINNTYDEYWLFWIAWHQNNESEILFSMSHDGSSGTPSTRTSTCFNAQQPTAGGTGDFSYQATRDLNSSTSAQQLTSNIQMNTDSAISGCLRLYQPSSSTYNTWYTWNSSYETTGGQIDHLYGAGYNQDAPENATNWVRISCPGSSPTIDHATIKLYGVG